MQINDDQFVVQAIETRWHGPTNHRGSRVTARADAGSVTVGWDYALNSEQNHRKAAETLMRKLGWDGPIVQGGLPGTHSGYCFVQLRPAS